MTVSDERLDELAANLSTVRERIRRAAEDAGRDASEVTLVVVTKTWPASDVRLLAELGVKDVGENRDQEAAPKAAELADLDLAWHFIGQLQTNKARSVARYADVVESIDRVRLVNALDRAAEQAGRRLSALAQVVFDDQPGRGGASGTELAELVSAIEVATWLDLAGVMAVAPLGVDPTPSFRQLALIAQEVRTTHPTATVISAGMSSDLEAAIACGATHVRVGSAVLGHRPPVG